MLKVLKINAKSIRQTAAYKYDTLHNKFTSKASYNDWLELIKSKNILEEVPRKFCTKELCEIAVKNDTHALQFVPKKLITEELCLLAVESYGPSLTMIPKKFHTEKLIKIAMKNRGNNWEVPNKFLEIIINHFKLLDN